MPFNSKVLFPFLLIAIVIYFSIFTVNQWQQAIVFKFREIYRSDNQPGIHFMIPLVNYAQKIEKRLLNLDQEPQRFLQVSFLQNAHPSLFFLGAQLLSCLFLPQL